MKTTIQFFILMAIFALATSCKKENQHTEITPQNPLVKKATEILKGNLIFGQHVKMSNVNKTLLPGGCPTKFNFEWKAKEQYIQIYLNKIKPGAMPFPISMTSNAKFLELNTWEKDEYKGEGWIKFFDNKAAVTAYQEGYDQPLPKPDGSAIVTGYFNVNTMEIEFLINYNVMNVTGHVFKQKVDKSRSDFAAELYRYEEGLCEYKLDNGHARLLPETTEKAINLLKGRKTVSAHITLDGKKAAASDKLPLKFAWTGTPVTNAKGRMAVVLNKTVVNGGKMQISIEANARWLDMLTWAEEKIYESNTSRWIKLKAEGVKTTLWSADGNTKSKTSDKSELRLIVDTKEGKATFSLKDTDLKLQIDAPLGTIN